MLTGSRQKALQMEGRRLLKSGHSGDALELFRQMVVEWPEEVGGYRGMSQAYEAMGLRPEARRDATIADAMEALENNPDDLKARMGLTDAFLDKEMPGWAAFHAEKALAQSPERTEVLNLAARAFQQNGNYDRAVAVLRKLLQNDPLSAELYQKLYANLRRGGHQAEAMRVGSLATALTELRQNAGNSEAVAGAVRAFLGFGQRKLALRLLEQNLSDSQPQPELLVMRGRMQMDERNHTDAILSLRKALDIDPTLTDAHRLLVEIYIKEANPKRAQHHHNLARTLVAAGTAKDEAERLTIMVRVLLDANRPDLARGHVEMMVKEHPDHWRTLFALGMLMRKEGKLGEALKLFERAKSRNSMSPELHMEMAHLHSDDGRGLEAVGEARHAVNLDPRNFRLRRQLAEVLRTHGFMDKAIEEEELAEAIKKATEGRRGAV